MAIVEERDNFGKRIAEVLGLDPRTVVGIDIRIEPDSFVTATAKLVLKENQAKGFAAILDEMKFIGVKKPPAAEVKVSIPPLPESTVQPVYWPCQSRKWFSWFPALILLLAGCSQPPTPPEDLRPWLATSGMYCLMLPSPAPLPPAPTPGAKCENCRGTGIVGDKVTGITCPICGGTGVAPAKALRDAETASRPARSAAPGAVSVDTDGGPTFRIVCEDGVCRRVKVMPATGR